MADADVLWLQRLENYERVLATLERALTLAASCPLSELEQQGLIQAFEFSHELSWLLLKDFLVNQGVSGISGSRDAVRRAMARDSARWHGKHLDGDESSAQFLAWSPPAFRWGGNAITSEYNYLFRLAQNQHPMGYRFRSGNNTPARNDQCAAIIG